MNEPVTSFVVSRDPITSIFGEDSAGDDLFDANRLVSNANGAMTSAQQNWSVDNRQSKDTGAHFFNSLDHGSRYDEVNAVHSDYNQLEIDQNQGGAISGYEQYQYGTAMPLIENHYRDIQQQNRDAGSGSVVGAQQQGHTGDNRIDEYRIEGQGLASTFAVEDQYEMLNQFYGDTHRERGVADVQQQGTVGLGGSARQGGPPPMAFKDQNAHSVGLRFRSIDSIQGKNMYSGSEHYGAGFLPPGVSHVPQDVGHHQDSAGQSSHEEGESMHGGESNERRAESGNHVAVNPTTWQSNAIFGGDETETGQEQQGEGTATLAWEQRALGQNPFGGPPDFRTARKIFDSDSDSLPDVDEFKKTEESPARTKLQRYDDLMKKLGKDQHNECDTAANVQSEVEKNKEETEDHKIKINPNLQAGRRKLEEFKRKKAAALSRKSSAQKQGDSPSSEQQIPYSQDSELHAADASHDEIVRLKSELGMASKELEIVDAERNNLQREKASLLGEIMSLKAITESKPSNNGDSEKAIELLKDELDTVKCRCQSLETNVKEKDIMCLSLTEENGNLQKEINALKINSGVFVEREQAERLGVELENLRTALSAAQTENEALRANHQTALQQERGAREQLEQNLEDSKDNIESLRELLGEGEQERLGMAETIAALRRDLENAQVPQTGMAAQDSNIHLELEDKIRTLETSLESAQQEIAERKSKCEQSTEPFQPSGSPVSPSLDSNSLRVRLAKAEAAVETERRTIQMLEQKLKDNQDQEQDISTLRNELSLSHKREDELERKLAESGSSSATHNAPLEGMREAEKRAEEAEQAAKLLQIQLDSSSRTIMKLSDEVNDLTTRLNEQADIIISMKQHNQPFDTVPLTAPHPTNSLSSPAHQHTEPQEYHEKSNMYQELQTCAPDRSEEKHGLETGQHHQEENHHVQQQQEEQVWSIPGAQIESIRSIPEAPRLGSTANPAGARDSFQDGNQAPSRKIGFWQWVAGADLASAD
eukprot:jgi/Picsp_1/5091/NSC_02454-R1_---NA---